jgi:serine/threonine-protein kinase
MEASAPPRSSDPSSVHGRFLPGASLGERFRIVGLLGRGGMGEVYRADDLELDQSVALKFLPEKLVADPAALDRLRGEVRTARQISHPNICRVYDIAQAEGHVFLSMEYVDGDDLAHVLRRLGPPSKDKAVEIARQLCLGLAAAHENKVLHRDLKPANVMLDGRGRVRITDFGLAGLADELEANPQRAGTPAYMAPEQLETGTVSVRSDIYSLGLLLYELFTGKQAFAGESLEELQRSRSSGSVPSMRSQNESVDPAIERVILRCLEPAPADRPPSVYAVLAALPGGDPLAAALAAGETPSPDMVASARERGGLSPRWAVSLFAAVLLTLGLGAIVGPKCMIAPEMGPDELGVLAREMVRDLGHELPRAEAAGLIQNSSYLAHLERESGGRGWGNDRERWPPPYFHWHRASPASLKPNDIHHPVTSLGDPLAAPPGSVAIVLGSGGQLVELEVVPQPSRNEPEAEAEAVDWSLVLEQAGLDVVELQPTAPARNVPSYCNEVVAFRVERPEESGGEYVFQAGAHRGRVVHATTVWDWDEGGPLARSRSGQFQLDRLWSVYDGLLTATYILSALLAWYNMRLGRGDRRGAVTYGVVVFVAYFLYSAANARISESGIGAFLAWVVGWDPLGHASMHALHTTLVYLAIEPYVRRVWPRALIGWARLARGRWKDPAVARETLIGIAVPLLGGTLLGGGVDVVRLLTGHQVTRLYYDPGWLGNSARMATEIPHIAALAMFFAMIYYFVLLVLRLLTRRDWATIALIVGLPLLGSLRQMAGLLAEGGSVIEIAETLIPVVFITIMVMMMMRFGLIAVITALFVTFLAPGIPSTFDMSAFYAPQAMLGMLVLVAMAVYGFRYSLAGQPVFRDTLSDGQETRAVSR